MSDLVLGSSDPRLLASHMALIGLASIAEAAFGGEAVRVRWTGGMAPRPVVSVGDRSPEEVAEAVRAHAQAAAAPDSWLSEDHPDEKGTPRGLMSPRRARAPDEEGRRLLVEKRRVVVDRLAACRAVLDLRMLGGLGEPSHWHVDRKGDRHPDWGATLFDMQARNNGSELVRSKLRPLASAVGGRTVTAVLDGLQGSSVCDDLSGTRTDGLTATGLAPAGPFDSALAWCALWGMAGLPVAPRANRPSVTTAAVYRPPPSRFVMPMVDASISPARLRSLLADARLSETLFADDPSDRLGAERWLAERAVRALVAFDVVVGGSKNAPLRSALLGVVHPVVGAG